MREKSEYVVTISKGSLTLWHDAEIIDVIKDAHSEKDILMYLSEWVTNPSIEEAWKNSEVHFVYEGEL